MTYKSKAGKKYKYQGGEKVTVTITPITDSPEETIEIKYNVKTVKKAAVFKGVKFERM